jgi:hypothetical protein
MNILKIAVLLLLIYGIMFVYLWYSYGRNIHRGDG